MPLPKLIPLSIMPSHEQFLISSHYPLTLTSPDSFEVQAIRPAASTVLLLYLLLILVRHASSSEVVKNTKFWQSERSESKFWLQFYVTLWKYQISLYLEITLWRGMGLVKTGFLYAVPRTEHMLRRAQLLYCHYMSICPIRWWVLEARAPLWGFRVWSKGGAGYMSVKQIDVLIMLIQTSMWIN